MYSQLVSSYLELLQHADQNNKNAGDEEDAKMSFKWGGVFLHLNVA